MDGDAGDVDELSDALLEAVSTSNLQSRNQLRARGMRTLDSSERANMLVVDGGKGEYSRR